MDKTLSSSLKSYSVSQDDLTLINRFTINEVSADEVFVFNLILCDNEVDRDGECFSREALASLSELFIGVTGIFDHAHSSKNQTARIFDAKVEEDSARKTVYGETYTYLKAKAYMLRIERNAELIKEIDAGIKKEVSVCCSVKEHVCSICGNDMRSAECTHQKGAEYFGKLCYAILSEPADAYEWSFVAIPAQTGAGVTKSYKRKKPSVAASCFDCIKAFGDGQEITIPAEVSKQLGDKLSQLRSEAEEGSAYRNELTGQTLKYALLVLNDVNADTVKSMCASLCIDELKQMRDSFMKKASQVIPLDIQLCPVKKESASDNKDFIF